MAVSVQVAGAASKRIETLRLRRRTITTGTHLELGDEFHFGTNEDRSLSQQVAQAKSVDDLFGPG